MQWGWFRMLCAPVSEPLISHPALFQSSLILGQLGVGLFFVISGYVIPGAVLRGRRGKFLLMRLIRLWPTYVVGFGLGALILYLLSGGAPAFTLADVLGHLALGIRDLIGGANIDGIVWTLEIEMKFYLVCALFMPRSVGALVYYVCIVAFGALALTQVVTWGTGDAAFGTFKRTDSLMQFLNVLILMQIGTLAYLYERGLVSARIFCGILAFIVICFVLATRPGAWAVGSTLQVKALYLLAAGLFLASYRARVRWLAVLHWLGEISYSLYVLHAILGYATVYLLVQKGVPVWLAALAAMGTVIFAADLSMRLVERASLRLIARLKQ